MRKKPLAYIISDIHYNIYGEFNEDDRRIKVPMSLVEKVYRLAGSKNCPVLCPGDLIHNPISINNLLLHYIIPHLKKCHKITPGYFISGNHDQYYANYVDNQSPSYVNTFSKIIKGMNCVDFRSVDTGKFVLHGIPYIKHNEKFIYALENKLKLSNNKPNILMIHTDLHGAMDTNNRKVGKVSNIPKDMGALFQDFDMVLCGHIHKPQRIVDGKVYMIGAPWQQRKTDINNKLGYWVLYDNMDMEFNSLDGPEFKSVKDLSKASKKDKYNFLFEKIDITDQIEIDVKTKKPVNILKAYMKTHGIKDEEKINLIKSYLGGYL